MQRFYVTQNLTFVLIEQPAAWVLRWPFVRQADDNYALYVDKSCHRVCSVAHEVTGHSRTVIYSIYSC